MAPLLSDSPTMSPVDVDPLATATATISNFFPAATISATSSAVPSLISTPDFTDAIARVVPPWVIYFFPAFICAMFMVRSAWIMPVDEDIEFARNWKKAKKAARKAARAAEKAKHTLASVSSETIVNEPAGKPQPKSEDALSRTTQVDTLQNKRPSGSVQSVETQLVKPTRGDSGASDPDDTLAHTTRVNTFLNKRPSVQSPPETPLPPIIRSQVLERKLGIYEYPRKIRRMARKHEINLNTPYHFGVHSYIPLSHPTYNSQSVV
ncbi:hypothetical protein B0H11DRAFT_2433710 [Mycena galericulata]|nr:hypothetical protein B0H11DRAFT_2433710 [Mycena galericulata]